MKIYLASKSPQRHTLLKQISIDFELINIDIDESVNKNEMPSDYVRRIATEKSKSGKAEDKKIFTSACNFIGLLKESKNNWLEFKRNKSKISEKEILSKIEERNKARENKNYELSDKIRDELLNKGVLIEDNDGRTTWKFK